MNPMAVLIMGSESDLDEAVKLEEKLVGFNVPVERHILSAHRNTANVKRAVDELDMKYRPLVYVAYAGKKPDLGPVIAGNTDNPVVAYVKQTEPNAFYTAHLLSSLDTPPGVSLAVFSDPTNAAIYVAKIFGLQSRKIMNSVRDYRCEKAGKNARANDTYGPMPLAGLKAELAKKQGGR